MPAPTALARPLLLITALLTSACAASLREATTPAPPDRPLEVPWSLNPELLLPGTKHIRFVVELMEGQPPELAALDDLVRVAAHYGGRPASWTLRARPAPLPLEPDVSYVFVKYVGHQLPSFGRAYARRVGERWVYFIIINQEVHRRFAAFVPQRRLEQQTLVHEYGHLLGLPTPDHGYYAQYPDLAGGMHCVNPDCPLSKPRPRALLYNIFHAAFERRYLEDYCEQCRHALSAAQAHWRTPKQRATGLPEAAP